MHRINSAGSSLLALITLTAFPVAAVADIVSSSPTHYVLHQSETTSMRPSAVWQRLIDPSSWWHPDHTYSGDAGNLTLKLEAGGLWRENWDGRSVSHGTVLYVEPNSVLRLEAPFGPLQGVGAYTIWTITLEEIESGTRITFAESAVAPPSAKLDELAKAVDFVKSEAIARLAATE